MANRTETEFQRTLGIQSARLDEINALLLDPNSQVIQAFLEIVAQYGTPQEINRRATEARLLGNLMARLKEMSSPYMTDLQWLIEQRDKGVFISESEYRHQVLGERVDKLEFRGDLAVTLEISALQYFPFLIAEARQAIARRELLPGRFIRVRKMNEQEKDGDILAVAAAMHIIGASHVETLDTRGTDGSNVHLGGPDTIAGYFGGVGQPNDHALQWLDECLYYYTTYGIQQVLNVNPGTVLLGYLLYKLGVNCTFKISVFMGNDNPYAALWTLIGAKLFAREDGTSPLIGFNWSNSVDNETIRTASEVRKSLGFEDVIRFEHHITETYKHIVRQPYIRRDELMEIATQVPNISAKHEGSDPEVERTREHPSDVLDYFRDKTEIETSGDMPHLLRNYLDKHDAVNATARALTENGLAFIAAKRLHHAQ